MKLSKNILSVIVAFSLFLFAGLSFAAEPGVYLLFAWGTLDPDTLRGVEISEKKIEAAFVKENDSSYDRFTTAGGLADVNSYVKRKITLKGRDATNANIVKACESLAAEAGPNDAVMVYILCHGATIKGKDGKLRHGLAPIATSAKELQMNRYGIARGTIMRAIKSRPHRLNVLITDACSARVKFEELEPLDGGPDLGGTNSYLCNFLLNARGNLNVNSSRPDTPTAPGELARGCAPTKWANVPSDPDAREAYEQYAGTVFTNAFLQVAIGENFTFEECNVDTFFEKLRAKLNEQYQGTKLYLKETNQASAYTTFNQQKTQTLTRFDDDSVAFPEDLSYRFKEQGSSTGSSDDGF